MSLFSATVGQLYKRGPQRVVRKACDLKRLRGTNEERKTLADAEWKKLLLGQVKTAKELEAESGLTLAGVYSAIHRLTNAKLVVKLPGNAPSPHNRRPRCSWTWNQPKEESCK